jgi:arylsulfatase A-like enzyme
VPAPEWQGKSGLGDYADFVMQTDASVGALLASLDKAGVASDTLVIFTSDNGCSPHAGTEKLEAQGHFASAQFRGYKSDIWEGGHRVPFIVRWPGQIKAATQNAHLVCLGDIMATSAEITNTKLPENAAEDSISFLPALRDETIQRSSIVHHSISGRFAMREGRWKLALCPGSGGWSKGDGAARKQALPPVQLYDVQADPGETKNVQSDHPGIVERLRAMLEKIIADGRSTPGAPQKNDARIDMRGAAAAPSIQP